MNKSPQYNQQTEPKQCKSEVELNMFSAKLETGPITPTISENKKRFTCQRESIWSKSTESSQIRELHEIINF